MPNRQRLFRVLLTCVDLAETITVGYFKIRGSSMKNTIGQCGRLVIASLAISLVASTAELATKKVLTLSVAKEVAAAAEAHAVKNQWNVVIAILDDGGNLLYLERMDGTQIGSIEVAIKKAEAAVSYRRPTKVFGDAVAKGATALLALPGALPFEGGIPLKSGDDVLGAIGVSGVTAQQDGMIAQVGADVLTSKDGQ